MNNLSLLSSLSVFCCLFIWFLLFLFIIICFTLDWTDASTVYLFTFTCILTSCINHFGICTRPLKCSILLIIYFLRIFRLIWEMFLDFFYFILYFTINFKSSTLFWTHNAKIIVKFWAVMNYLNNIIKLRVFTVSSSNR